MKTTNRTTISKRFCSTKAKPEPKKNRAHFCVQRISRKVFCGIYFSSFRTWEEPRENCSCSLHESLSLSLVLCAVAKLLRRIGLHRESVCVCLLRVAAKNVDKIINLTRKTRNIENPGIYFLFCGFASSIFRVRKVHRVYAHEESDRQHWTQTINLPWIWISTTNNTVNNCIIITDREQES